MRLQTWAISTSANDKYVQAEIAYLIALKCFEQKYGRKHYATLQTMHNISRVYALQGKLHSAEIMLVDALRGQIDVLGVEHTSTLVSLSSLGRLYVRQNRPVDAKRICAWAIKICESILGQMNASVCRIGNPSPLDQGELVEVAGICAIVIETLNQLEDRPKIMILKTMDISAMALFYQGRADDAEKLLEAALSGFEETLGLTAAASSLSVAGVRCNLGILFCQSGRNKLALPLFEVSLAAYAASEGPLSQKCKIISGWIQEIHEGDASGSEGKRKAAEASTATMFSPDETEKPGLLGYRIISRNLTAEYGDALKASTRPLGSTDNRGQT